jgi:GAF domain
MRRASARRRSARLYIREGDGFRAVAVHNAPPAYVEARMRELIRSPPDAPLGRIAATKQVVHIADIKTIPSYLERNPFVVTPVELGGYRTVLGVPMLKDTELIGAISIFRQDVRRFTDKQVAALSASHSRAATTCRSKAERLMTFSTSAVAVCCCNDSRSSLRLLGRVPKIHGNLSDPIGSRLDVGTSLCRGQDHSCPRCSGRSGLRST